MINIESLFFIIRNISFIYNEFLHVQILNWKEIILFQLMRNHSYTGQKIWFIGTSSLWRSMLNKFSFLYSYVTKKSLFHLLHHSSNCKCHWAVYVIYLLFLSRHRLLLRSQHLLMISKVFTIILMQLKYYWTYLIDGREILTRCLFVERIQLFCISFMKKMTSLAWSLFSGSKSFNV